MANCRIKLLISILVLLPSLSYAAKGVKYKINHKKTSEQDIICYDESRPYVVLSRKDKERLERIINDKSKFDPNLNKP